MTQAALKVANDPDAITFIPQCALTWDEEQKWAKATVELPEGMSIDYARGNPRAWKSIQGNVNTKVGVNCIVTLLAYKKGRVSEYLYEWNVEYADDEQVILTPPGKGVVKVPEGAYWRKSRWA